MWNLHACSSKNHKQNSTKGVEVKKTFLNCNDKIRASRSKKTSSCVFHSPIYWRDFFPWLLQWDVFSFSPFHLKVIYLLIFGSLYLISCPFRVATHDHLYWKLCRCVIFAVIFLTPENRLSQRCSHFEIWLSGQSREEGRNQSDSRSEHGHVRKQYATIRYDVHAWWDVWTERF